MNLKYQLGPKIWDFNRAAVMFTIGNNGVQILKKKKKILKQCTKFPSFDKGMCTEQCTLCLYTLFSNNAFCPEF